MVQQGIFGFWWIDRYNRPFEDYEIAKACLEECASEYEPILEKGIVSVIEMRPVEKESRMWDTQSRPITPTPAEDK